MLLWTHAGFSSTKVCFCYDQSWSVAHFTEDLFYLLMLFTPALRSTFVDIVCARTKGPAVAARPLALQHDVAQECGQTVWCLQTFVFALSGIGGE